MIRTRRVVLGMLVTATVLWVLTFAWILRPGTDVPERADALIVFVGGRGERLALMNELLEDGVATHVVVAAADMDDTSIFGRLCRSGLPEPYTISCVESRDDTRGEAQILGRFANRQGWNEVVVVTSSYHLTRASLLLERCFRGRVAGAASSPSAGPALWFGHVLHEWGGLVETQVKRGC